MRNKEFKLIGLTGTNAAGKGEAASYFMKKGFCYYSLSDLIREELKRKGKEVTRDNLIRAGNSMREKHGPDILARRVMEKIKKNSVIDSIRNPKEIEFLKRQKNFILLAVDSPVALRYERTRKRGRDESAANLEEFIQKEQEEMTAHEKGQQLRTCMEMADVTVINDGSLEKFHRKLEALL